MNDSLAEHYRITFHGIRGFEVQRPGIVKIFNGAPTREENWQAALEWSMNNPPPDRRECAQQQPSLFTEAS
jgi:hypothetical protein